MNNRYSFIVTANDKGCKVNKQRFTRVDGSKGSAPKVSAMPALRPGHWWINKAPMGAGFNHWVETLAPIKVQK